MARTLPWLLQVRHHVPYMGRFDADWATSKIMSQYGVHLRREARKNKELPTNPRYAYLKANAAKRRKDAPRGVRPGIAKGQDQADMSHGSSLSEAGSSSSSNINTARDVEMMDMPGLFGILDPSDDGDQSTDDDDDDGDEGRN